MEEKKVSLFAEKIKQVYKVNDTTAQENARKLLEDIPEKLLINVEEWVKGEELSDIYIREFSVPMVLTLWQSKDFLSALRVMKELEKSPENALRQIWHMRR